MFGELPKLFDRNFALAYFLPAASFIALNLWLTQVLKLRAGFLSWMRDLVGRDLSDQVLIAALVGLLALLGGLLLLTLNRTLYRLVEGYWPFRERLNWFQRRRYGRLQKRIVELDRKRDEYRDRGEPLPDEIRSKRREVHLRAAEEFPHDESFVLPTALGNTIRAFEVYPVVMYGMDGIEGWSRLLSVVPKDYRELIDSAKAETDFWLNLGILAGAFVIEYVGLQVWLLVESGSAPLLSTLGFLVGGLLAVWVGYWRARIAAIEWGSLSKAAFDVFLPELRKRLNLPELRTDKDRRDQLLRLSQAIVYRNPEAMPDGAKTEPCPAVATERVRSTSLVVMLGILAISLFTAILVFRDRLRQRS